MPLFIGEFSCITTKLFLNKVYNLFTFNSYVIHIYGLLYNQTK